MSHLSSSWLQIQLGALQEAFWFYIRKELWAFRHAWRSDIRQERSIPPFLLRRGRLLCRQCDAGILLIAIQGIFWSHKRSIFSCFQLPSLQITFVVDCFFKPWRFLGSYNSKHIKSTTNNDMKYAWLVDSENRSYKTETHNATHIHQQTITNYYFKGLLYNSLSSLKKQHCWI